MSPSQMSDEHVPTGYNLSVWDLHYKSSYPERVPTCGGTDSELSGRVLTADQHLLMAAPTEELVRAAFQAQHADTNVIISCTCLGRLYAIVRIDGTARG